MISRQRMRLASAVALLVCLAAIPALAQETVTLFVASQTTDTVQVFRGANHASGTVTIVDGNRRAVLGTLKVAPGPHGLAVLAR